MKEKINVYNENKINKVTFSQVLVLILLILMFIILVLETRNLVLYTIGEKTREEAIVYNLIYKIANKNAIQKDLKIKEEYKLSLAILGNVNSSKETLNKSLSNADFKEEIKKYDVLLTNISENVNKNQKVDIKEILNSNNINSIEYEDNCCILEHNNIKIGMFVQDLEDSKNINSANIQKIINKLNQNNVDLIICFLNNKNLANYKFVTEDQTNAVDELFENGADIVIGVNSKTFQSFTEDNIEFSDSTKHVYSIYSIGNLVDSSSSSLDNFSLLSNIEIKKVVYNEESSSNYTKVVTYNVGVPKLLYSNTSSKNVGIYVVENVINDNRFSNKILNEIQDNFQRYNTIYNNY